LLRPIDVIRCFHNAFRRDLTQIDTLVLNIAREGGDMAPIFERLRIVGDILDYHAKGEEAAVFPAVDKFVPLLAQPYILDHRELDSMVSTLETIRDNPEVLAAARATAVLNSQLRIHLDKEDMYLYPFLSERTTDDEQIAIGRVMSSKTPPERVPVQVQWLFPLLDFDDQLKVIKSSMTMLPAPVFAKLKPLVEKSVSTNWVRLTQQIPELLDK
jgi:iron-sulfur cluster repair protein YtfE (RIC family)